MWEFFVLGEKDRRKQIYDSYFQLFVKKIDSLKLK